MAFSGENANLTWQRVQIALDSLNASPHTVAAFKRLKSFLAQDKGNPNLQFIPIDKTVNGSDGGNADTVLCSGAARIYGFFVRKNTGTTAGYNKISNHASAIQAQGEIILADTQVSEESVFTSNKGKVFSTGLTYASVTAYNGTTHSTTANSCSGFALIAGS